MTMKKIPCLIGFGLACAVLVAADLWTVRVGDSPNDGKGDSLRAAFQKVNSNFVQVAAWAQPALERGLVAWWDFTSGARVESGYDAACASSPAGLRLESFNCAPDDDYGNRWTPNVAYNAAPRGYMRSAEVVARPTNFSVAIWWHCDSVNFGYGDLLWGHGSLGSIGLTNTGGGLKSFFAISGTLHVGGPISDDSDQLIVWTYDGNTLRNYVNGGATSYCGDDELTLPGHTNDHVYFGDWLGTSYYGFCGGIYSASYWRRVLTVGETQTLWNDGDGKRFPPW
jgi:hypothetical protein